MTDKKSRRVVIINNINSDTIDQAIFILKSDKRDGVLYKSDSVVLEAQKIINNYIKQVERLKYDYKSPCKKKSFPKNKFWSIFLSLAALTALIAAFITTANFLN